MAQSSVPTPKKELASFGKTGEQQAADFLCSLGYRLIGTNYKAGRVGEIDLIMQNGDTLVFIEVRTRHTTSGGTPE